MIIATLALTRISRINPCPACTKVRFRLSGDFGYGFLQIPHWQLLEVMVNRLIEPPSFFQPFLWAPLPSPTRYLSSSPRLDFHQLANAHTGRTTHRL